MKFRCSASIVYLLLAFTLMCLANQLNLKVFVAWSQVQDLWESGFNFSINHPHFYRFLVVYPGFLLESIFPLKGFAWYVSGFFAINVILFRRLSNLVLGKKLGPLMITVFICFHLMMNGRGVIGWTGWLMAACICLDAVPSSRIFHRIIWIFTSAFLASVSSGVFAITVASLFYFLTRRYMYFRFKLRKVWIATILSTSIPIYFIVHYLKLSIGKNLAFYGGGLTGAIRMLKHGIGNLFIANELIFIAFISFITVLLSLFLITKAWRFMTSLDILICFPLLGGFFGITVLTLAIPLILLRLRRTLKVSPILSIYDV